MIRTATLITLFSILTCSTTHTAPSCTTIKENEHHYRCTLSFGLEPADCILLDTIDISVDNPKVTIHSWHTQEPTQRFIPEFKETKKVLTGDGNIEVILDVQSDVRNPRLHIRFYQRTMQRMVEHLFTLEQVQSMPELKNNITIESSTPSTSIAKKTSSPSTSWVASLSAWFTTTDSMIIRIMLAFILGLLLSLTPCIYPMIPITIGILQAQAQPTMMGNMARATAYTVGIATTFSALGLLAAGTGQLFGTIMNNPLVIGTIILFLLYMAGSMIGFYEMYTPSFLQNRSAAQGGSIVSAFMFGALSGTIASPCLSPGLVLLLTIVTQLKSILLGFILLFSFGIGLSTPLLLIGTFSSSLQVLPKAGLWMVDIKKVIGFMMVGICFYFANNLLPVHVTLLLFGMFVMFMGLFYLNEGTKSSQSLSRTIKKSSGTMLVAASILFLAKGYQLKSVPPEISSHSFWQSDYLCCLEQAKKENKKLLLDVSTPYCTICKAIDKKLFMNETVTAALSNTIIPIKIDDLDSTNPVHRTIQERYNILGVPTLLLINPVDERQLLCWGTELYDCDPEEFIRAVEGQVGT